jgi:hypothetical protein
MSVRVLVVLTLWLALVVACGSTESGAPKSRVQMIDDVAGTYRGVRLGDTPADLERALGPADPAGEYEPITPLATGFDTLGPPHIPYPGGPCPEVHYRFERASFGFNCGTLLWFETVEEGSATSRGVAVGDPLESVEDAYPEARCGTAGSEEYGEFPACVAKVAAERHIWFGGDPITTITLAAVRLAGVTVDKPFTGQIFTLEDGDFVTFPPGEVKRGDKIVCVIDGKRIESPVPRPGVAYSIDPMLVFTKPNGEVTAECGGIHAETAPPGSW